LGCLRALPTEQCLARDNVVGFHRPESTALTTHPLFSDGDFLFL
jgi:hypothetical protein